MTLRHSHPAVAKVVTREGRVRGGPRLLREYKARRRAPSPGIASVDGAISSVRRRNRSDVPNFGGIRKWAPPGMLADPRTDGVRGVQNRTPRIPQQPASNRAELDAILTVELASVVTGARRRALRDGDRQIDTAHLLHSSSSRTRRSVRPSPAGRSSPRCSAISYNAPSVTGSAGRAPWRTPVRCPRLRSRGWTAGRPRPSRRWKVRAGGRNCAVPRGPGS